ncbi:MAG: transketolase [Firmicutes bacterium]|jgi:transketolase|nr:transketolase [Bacillota bacterium]
MAGADEQVIKELAKQARKLRKHVIEMLGEAGSGHPGGSLSAADIMTVLYWHEMNIDPARPDWPDRDRFVLSKGHAAPILYAVLAEKGYFPVEDLKTLRKIGSHLQGHPDSTKTPGVEVPTGSLGQGLSLANGMALAAKMDGRDYRVYALLGDGELEEGMVWEAAMTSAHYKLDNLVAIVDNNNLQIDGDVREVMGVDDIALRFRSFGWYALDIDGHDLSQIMAALRLARGNKGQPTVIVAHTVKGKGVSFMENQVGWHGNAPSKEQTEAALVELAAGEE